MPIEETSNTTVQTNTSSVGESPSVFSRIRWGDSYVSLLLGALVVIIAAVLGFFYVKIQQPKQELLPPVSISRNVKLTITPSKLASATSVSVTSIKLTHSVTNTPTPHISPSSIVVNRSKNTSNTAKQHTYIVQRNDNLWDIAEKEYGSGYNYVDIIKANNLANPGMIFTGDTLVIPTVTPILVQGNQNNISTQPTTIVSQPTIVPPNAINGTSYTVEKGDTLWSISVRAYADGYKWAEIAKANNLTNPSLIHSGNVLKIPRQQTL